MVFSAENSTGSDLSVLSVLDSREVFFSNVTFQGRNLASISTRAVYCDNSTITFESCIFNGNTGDFGGAIYASGGSHITLNGNLFVKNRALKSGGAIFAYNSSIILEETLGNIFAFNSAEIRGGAIYCIASTMETARLSDIPIELFIWHTALQCFVGTALDFINKTAYSLGGGVGIGVSKLVAHQLNFIGNFAIQGGGIIGTNSSYDLTSAHFANNTAENGGAISSTGDTITW